MATESTRPDPSRTSLKQGSVGVLGVMFFVLSAQAPLTGVVGPTPITIAVGNGAGAPAASLAVGVVIALFAVGFLEMSRRLDVHGAFYAYVSEGLGNRIGIGGAWLAVLAYGTIQGAMYGLYGFIFSGIIQSFTGVAIPWWAIVLVTIVLVQILGSRNIELGARILTALVLAEFAILIAFCVGVLLRGGGPEGFDLGASFAPEAVMSGAPGIAVIFAVASMVGFESTAIYSSEARNPRRTVPIATYLSVAVISLFYAFCLWMVISYYGPSQVVDAAAGTLSGDTSLFVIAALTDVLGAWIGPVVAILLVTSLLAGVIAFHNGVNRYLHSLGMRRALPRVLSHVNQHQAPYIAARVQSVMALVTITPFAVLGLDPAVTLFPWGGGVAVAALLVLYVLCTLAVLAYFRRTTEKVSTLRTLIIPIIALVLLLGLTFMAVVNFSAMVGGTGITTVLLLILVPIAFVGGVISTYFFPNDGPRVLEPGPFRHDEPQIEPI